MRTGSRSGGRPPASARPKPAGRDGGMGGASQPRGKGREEQDRLCKAGRSAPALLLLACLPGGKRDPLRRDRIWLRTAQSSGSTTKRGTKEFSLLAEALARRDRTTDGV